MAITLAQISQFLRDYAGFNILLGAVQFPDSDISPATEFTVARFNAIAPMSSYTVENFPNDWLLLMGTCIHLLRSESILQVRNMATYQDGDVQNIGVDDKFAQYQAVADRLDADWLPTSQKYKQQINMENGYGSLSSGYRYIYPGARSRR